MKIVKIYCLYDPIECKVRYIGRTTKKVLEHRLIEHISKSQYFNKYYPGKRRPYRVNWINKLIKEGREPKIKLLTLIEGWSESHLFERKLINLWKNKRDLVNLEDRGEGGLNRIVPEEDRIKIAESLKQFYKTGKNAASIETFVYDLNGKYIRSFESARKCAFYYKIPYGKVSACCLKNIPKYKDWIFSYKKEEKTQPYIFKRIKEEKRQKRKYYKITNLIDNKISIVLGIEEVEKLIGISRTNISNFIRLYKGIYKKKWKIQVLDKSDKLLENPEKDNQQPI